MKDVYINFNKKRMHIFSELVRRHWNGNLNHLAMGLDPNGRERFEEELDMIRESREIHKPIVSKVEGPCGFCASNWNDQGSIRVQSPGQEGGRFLPDKLLLSGMV